MVSPKLKCTVVVIFRFRPRCGFRFLERFFQVFCPDVGFQNETVPDVVVIFHYYYCYYAALKQISATAQLIVQRMNQEIHKTSPRYPLTHFLFSTSIGINNEAFIALINLVLS